MRRVKGLVRKLAGSNEAELVASLHAQVGSALKGADLASAALTGRVSSDVARETMGEVEHEGDAFRADLITSLGHSLVTPFDREDLFRLSRSIDDVLDNLRDFVREYDLFGAPGGERFLPVLAAVSESLMCLGAAVTRIVAEPAGITRGALEAKKVGNQVRQAYQVALAELLEEPLSTDLVKARELLRRLDVVGLRLGDAADALADGAMKRSH